MKRERDENETKEAVVDKRYFNDHHSQYWYMCNNFGIK